MNAAHATARPVLLALVVLAAALAAFRLVPPFALALLAPVVIAGETSPLIAASPLTHVRAGLPPTLLVYGGRDHLVEPRFGRAVARALVAAGDPVAYVELPWAEHGFDAVPGGVGERVATALTEQFLARVTVPSQPPRTLSRGPPPIPHPALP